MNYIALSKDVDDTIICPALNVPYSWVNRACELMYTDDRFSEYKVFAAFQIQPTGKVKVSLRSNNKVEEPFDVRPYAKTLGGGGHPTASGAVVDIEDFVIFIEHID